MQPCLCRRLTDILRITSATTESVLWKTDAFSASRALWTLSNSQDSIAAELAASTSGRGEGYQLKGLSKGLTTLPWPQPRQFSVARSLRAESPASVPAELNPLLQAPAPTGADGAPSTGVPSSHGPGKAAAVLRGIAMSPKKLNHFAAMIRRMHVDDALTQCRLTVKKAGKICAGVILSARANAENNHGLDPSKLLIDIINVGKGTHLKRMNIHGKGRSAMRLRYRCHLEIILKEGDQRPRMRFVRPLLERPRKHMPLPGVQTTPQGASLPATA